jgi:hypothetical protein
MKCPKCGYISFDYNDACPKCNKDISVEREKMNLPSYIPNPPSLLTALTGEGNEPEFDLKIESAESIESIEQEISLSPEDSQAIEAMEEAFKDSQELEIELDTGREDKEKMPREKVELSGLAPEISDTEIPDDIRSPDLAEPSPEDSEEIGLPHEVRAGGEEIALEKDILLEDSETGLPQVGKGARDDVDLEGDLPASKIPKTGKTSVFDPLKIDEESDSFDLEDLSGGKPGRSVDADFSLEAKDEALLDLEGLDSILDESVEGLEPSGSTGEGKDENLSLDLESLELDLDLETPEDKSS